VANEAIDMVILLLKEGAFAIYLNEKNYTIISYQNRCKARLIVNRHTMLANRQIIVNSIFGSTLQFFGGNMEKVY
jgi:hypothetical protein